MAEPNKKLWWQGGLSFFFRVSGWIAGPVLMALFLGKWLDRKFETAPWVFIGLTALAFLVSCVGIIKESKLYIKNAIEEEKRSKTNGNEY